VLPYKTVNTELDNIAQNRVLFEHPVTSPLFKSYPTAKVILLSFKTQ